jgi:hypothetical protein
MRRRTLAALLFPVLVMLATAARAVDLAPLKGKAASLHWSAPQFIQADVHGNVFLLRGDTFEVYPIGKSRDFGEPVRLGAAGSSGSLHDAAMSRQGDWVFLVGRDVHVYALGEDKVLPALGWLPVSVGFLHGDPVVGVTPPRLPAGPDEDAGAPPLLLRPLHDGWTAELREGAALPLDHRYDHMAERADRSVIVLDDREGRYYLARQYAYRIERRRQGRGGSLDELRIGAGKTVLRPAAEPDAQLGRQVKAEGMDTAGLASSSFRGVAALYALAQGGPGGLLYAVVGPGVADKKCALDRIDWERHKVDRVGINLPCLGRVSLAAGRDGLYFADFSGEEGRYFLGWDRLDTATWESVKDAKFTP